MNKEYIGRKTMQLNIEFSLEWSQVCCSTNWYSSLTKTIFWIKFLKHYRKTQRPITKDILGKRIRARINWWTNWWVFFRGNRLLVFYRPEFREFWKWFKLHRGF